MLVNRRDLIALTLASTAQFAACRVAQARDYPVRPVKLIVGFPAGGATDVVARIVSQWLAEQLGQPFVVENRPGAGTNIATESAVRSNPDGYTLFLASVSNAISATLYENLTFEFLRDLAPVCGICRLTYVMVANPAVPAKTIPEFIAYARSNPGKLNIAVAAVGSGTHLAGEMFKSMANIDVVNVPYAGSPAAFSDLLTGKVDVMFDVLTTSIDHISSQKLRALGVTTSGRSALIPDVPAIAETLPGYEASGWVGFSAPKNTPASVIEIIGKEINAALADPKVKGRLVELGGEPLILSAPEFQRLVAEETEKWGRVIRAAGLQRR